ncbi:hypothetical protein IG631_07920 [Alternaria alternata]|nr:hypothetical protein IG631_07920 [Alternaria alternata]
MTFKGEQKQMKSGMRFVGRDDGKDGGWRTQEMVPEAGFYQSELRADGQLVLLPP